jgi:molecular chaperone GrpE (heat shock protein)
VADQDATAVSADDTALETARNVAELTDLVRRRLLDDGEKQRTFDALYGELTKARALADGQYLIPLVRRLITVIDRLDGLCGQTGSGELFESVADELTDILAMHEVERITPESGAFDARIQEVAAVVGADEPADDGTVACVRRNGWRLGARVLRPMLVDVRRYEPGDPGEDPR